MAFVCIRDFITNYTNKRITRISKSVKSLGLLDRAQSATSPNGMRREHRRNAGTLHKAETFSTADTDVYIPAFQWRMNPINRFEHRPICVSLGGNMSKIQYKKTDPRIAKLIEDLRVKSRENDALIWRDIAGRLERSRKSYATVNLSRINRHVAENE